MTKYERLYTADEVDGMIARAKAAAAQPAPSLLAFAQNFLKDYHTEDGIQSMKHYAREAQAAIDNAAPVQPVAMTFDEAWASLSWQEWRMKSTKELFTELHRLTTPPAAAVPEGWKLVPVEPTEIMQDAGVVVMPTVDCHPYDAGMVYKAMLAAAPTQGETK